MAVDLQEDRAPLRTGDASNFQQGRTDVSNRLQKEVWYFRWMIMNQIQGKKLPWWILSPLNQGLWASPPLWTGCSPGGPEWTASCLWEGHFAFSHRWLLFWWFSILIWGFCYLSSDAIFIGHTYLDLYFTFVLGRKKYLIKCLSFPIPGIPSV